MPVNYGYGLNPYPAIILILIVLQWFRVSNSDGDTNDLTNNGGLFIITLFLLVYCSMAIENAKALAAAQIAAQARPRRGLFGRRWF